MRAIDKIIFHCSASDKPEFDDVSVMRKWHMARGFTDVGYHYFIRKDGVIQVGRPLDQIGAHTQGHNTGSVGVCFHGLNNFTPAQVNAIHLVVDEIEKVVGQKLELFSHRDFTHLKTCPNFVLADFLLGKVTIIKHYASASFLNFDDDSVMQEVVCDPAQN